MNVYSLFFSIVGFGIAWTAAKRTLSLHVLSREVQATPESEIDSIIEKETDSFFEFRSSALAGKSFSPITKQRCAAWEFEVNRVEPVGKGNTMSYPFAIVKSESSWILFEGKTHVIGIKFYSDRAEMSQTFAFTSVLGIDLPSELSGYLKSEKFKKYTKSALAATNNYHGLWTSFGTTFCENILPEGSSLHVFGRIRSLEESEANDLLRYCKSLKIKKPFVPLTLGGDELCISLKNEDRMLKRVRQSLIWNLIICLMALIWSFVFLYFSF